MKHYDITLRWSDDDSVFVAEVPDLPGCMAHGATQEAALASVREAIALWIDVARAAGDPVPVPMRRASQG